MKASRRRFLAKLAVVLAGSTTLAAYLQRTLALARRPFPQGVQEMKGEVTINNKPVTTLGSRVEPGDTVRTGEKGYVVFVIGQDAYLLREKSEIKITGDQSGVSTTGEVKDAIVKSLHIVKGRMLSVFGGGAKSISAPTVTLGVRGTAVYLAVEPRRTYVCTCYGDVTLEPKANPAQRERIRTAYHESPRYVYDGAKDELIEKAPVIDHGDDELIMLEMLMGRSPPFVGVYDSSRRY